MMIYLDRAADVCLTPNEWHFWNTRHATARQVRRWLARISPDFEVREVANYARGEQQKKVRVRYVQKPSVVVD